MTKHLEAERRRQILNAARTVFIKSGFAKPVEDVAKHAGLSKGGVFLLWLKRELFLGLVQADHESAYGTRRHRTVGGPALQKLLTSASTTSSSSLSRPTSNLRDSS